MNTLRNIMSLIADPLPQKRQLLWSPDSPSADLIKGANNYALVDPLISVSNWARVMEMEVLSLT